MHAAGASAEFRLRGRIRTGRRRRRGHPRLQLLIARLIRLILDRFCRRTCSSWRGLAGVLLPGDRWLGTISICDVEEREERGEGRLIFVCPDVRDFYFTGWFFGGMKSPAFCRAAEWPSLICMTESGDLYKPRIANLTYGYVTFYRGATIHDKRFLTRDGDRRNELKSSDRSSREYKRVNLNARFGWRRYMIRQLGLFI